MAAAEDKRRFFIGKTQHDWIIYFLELPKNMYPSNSITTVKIHEFSTGIKASFTADSSWISRGFTGRYMNFTLPNNRIPYTVERAIVNKLFAVVEGASSNHPAVIGRVVPGEQDWSVVAVVSRGRDHGGQPLSVYRYFLCEGENSFWKILIWMEQYAEQREGQLPIFNPFDTKVSLLEEISIPPEIPSEKLKQEFGNASVPIVLSREYQYNFKLINKIAEIKAGGQPVSWAYNAEALENLQKKYYSGKKRNHTFKNQFIVLPKGQDLVDVVAGRPRPKSDINLFRESQNIFDYNQRFNGDQAYAGEPLIRTAQKK